MKTERSEPSGDPRSIKKNRAARAAPLQVRSVFHQAIRFAALEKSIKVPFQSCATAQHSKKSAEFEKQKYSKPKKQQVFE
jgi:hypothetical protein